MKSHYKPKTKQGRNTPQWTQILCSNLKMYMNRIRKLFGKINIRNQNYELFNLHQCERIYVVVTITCNITAIDISREWKIIKKWMYLILDNLEGTKDTVTVENTSWLAIEKKHSIVFFEKCIWTTKSLQKSRLLDDGLKFCDWTSRCNWRIWELFGK